MENEDETDLFDPRSIYTKRILRMISMNSRVRMSEMAKVLGLSRKNVRLRLAKIEKAFKIKYTLEIDANKIGLTEPHLIVVRFKREPDYSEMAKMLAESPVTQLAVVTRGQFNMIIYANAFSRTEYYNWDSRMRNKLVIPHGTQWEESEISYQRLGFFPLRNEAIDEARLNGKDKAMLRILNDNARISLKKMAERTGIDYKTVAYRFKRLVSKGYIKRFTISMGTLQGRVVSAIFGRFIPSDDSAGVARITEATYTSDDPEPLMSKYLATAALMGSYGFFVLGAFMNHHRAYQDLVLKYKKIYNRFSYTEATHAEIMRVLIGRLPVRNVDNKKIYISQL